MKDPKIHFFNRIACLCTALRIERKLRLEQRLRKKLQNLEGPPARRLLYRMEELNLRTKALEIRYRRLSEGSCRPDLLAIG